MPPLPKRVTAPLCEYTSASERIPIAPTPTPPCPTIWMLPEVDSIRGRLVATLFRFTPLRSPVPPVEPCPNTAIAPDVELTTVLPSIDTPPLKPLIEMLPLPLEIVVPLILTPSMPTLSDCPLITISPPALFKVVPVIKTPASPVRPSAARFAGSPLPPKMILPPLVRIALPVSKIIPPPARLSRSALKITLNAPPVLAIETPVCNLIALWALKRRLAVPAPV